MITCKEVIERDKPLIEIPAHPSVRDSIYSIRAISKAFDIRNEAFMILFAITDNYYIMNKPITISGICKMLFMSDSNYLRMYRTTQTLLRKGLIEVVSMGNVHKYYIPTDKALEQISPLLR